jgi:transposase
MLEGLTPPPKFIGTCKVKTLASELDEKDREIFLNAVNDDTSWPVKTLRKALAERGLQISDSPLYSHRAKSCACFRR